MGKTVALVAAKEVKCKRFWHTGKCKAGRKCKFAHAVVTLTPAKMVAARAAALVEAERRRVDVLTNGVKEEGGSVRVR